MPIAQLPLKRISPFRYTLPDSVTKALGLGCTHGEWLFQPGQLVPFVTCEELTQDDGRTVYAAFALDYENAEVAR